jgi:hypothetical protein
MSGGDSVDAAAGIVVVGTAVGLLVGIARAMVVGDTVGAGVRFCTGVVRALAPCVAVGTTASRPRAPQACKARESISRNVA